MPEPFGRSLGLRKDQTGMKLLRGIIIGLFTALVALTGVSEWYARTRVDRTPHVISCEEGVLEVSVRADRSELLRGVTARDDRDGDLTDQIMVEHVSSLTGVDTARITYVVFDSSDNAATCSRTIRYTDYQKPRFRLTAPLRYYVGDTITLLDRLTAVDVIDGDLQEKIRLTASNLTNTLAGTYHVTVQVTNSLGDTSVLPLTILVDSGSGYLTPEIRLTEYLLYLNAGSRFDPGAYIQSITDPGAENQNVGREKAEIFSEVDPNTPGTYEVVYSYTGFGGREGKTILTVVVV